ncbi:phage GP46 family protein [uncultured Sphingomonas sp.]|uniref:phage GP46 family protein n=1 Tax=uncultured Sphingomonas sp. TaxID=158754 RepID=UPI0025973E22|nr:phage GP46 family protein [uncultured Sphingomonas sp.]
MDIATIWDAAQSRGDWAVPMPAAFLRDSNGRSVIGADGFAVRASGAPAAGLLTGADIETAVLISLFTDAAAGADDIIPDGTGDPRGWWADPTIGSKLWLLARAKRTPQNLQLAIAYIRQSLGWLTTDGVASAIDVAAEWQAGGRLAGQIVVAHAAGSTSVPFDYAWKDLA